ncbi:pre-mRNA-splicing factor CWC25-like [Homarus americanus]|uniref:pre-mRNA-splicing factor CWC25-like n=1 Tax=Homarus americanus TaxID=6706 RepID=UPI001C43B7E4|nr:pre-mRNA-splicing factor CWC25-like [Homarus americanus]
MRRFLFASLACLALLIAGVTAEEVTDEKEDQVVEVDDLDNIDLPALLTGLFNEEETTAEGDDEEGVDREARAKIEGNEDPTTPEDLTKFNNFIDTFHRRLNSYSRSKFDPLIIGLTKKRDKGGKSEKGKGGKGKSRKGGKSKKGGNKKKGQKKEGGGKRNERKNKKGRMGKRHPKDLDLGEAEDEDVTEDVAEDVAAVEVEEGREKREAPIAEEEEEVEEVEGSDREGKAMVDEEVAEEDIETSRQGVAASTPRRSKNKKTKEGGGKNKRNKKGRNKKNKNKNKGKKEEEGNDGGKKNKKNNKNKNKNKVRTSRASVNGIATLRRDGDVKVVNKKNGKEIRSMFTLGPVDLKLTRKFGFGKDAITRNAKATSPSLKGRMHIFVSADGTAKVTKLHVAKPAIVTVDGSLSKETRSDRDDNNFMEKSIGKVTPVATKKLKQAIRDVLSVGSPNSN